MSFSLLPDCFYVCVCVCVCVCFMCARGWCTSLSLPGGHSSYPPSYFKREILPIKLHFIGVRSFACKMVHWLHSPPVLLILIHLQPKMLLCVCVCVCVSVFVWKREKWAPVKRLCVMYCNLLTRWPHPGPWHCDIQYTAYVCVCVWLWLRVSAQGS